MPSASLPDPIVANESERDGRFSPVGTIAAPLAPQEAELEVDLDGDLESDLEAELDADPDEELETPALPRRLVPLSSEASRVVLARGLSRDGMRADPSQRLARSAELNLALHLEVGGPPIHVRAHVEPAVAGEPEPGPWLRFTELAPGDGERLDALLAGLSIFAGGDGPEHALVVCEILEPPCG
jgi:hypothetical protein